ncbi:MAG: helicase [candidate division Zixibacteria bacterium]|nr:helicase [candidate division Zixibacteria bacterium]
MATGESEAAVSPIAQPDEILQESPVQRYSAGVLFPASQQIIEIEDSEIADEQAEAEEDEPAIVADEEVPDLDKPSRGDDAISYVYDETVRLANEFFPAAIGLTFIAEMPNQGLLIRARAAEYRSKKPADPDSKLREWHRFALDIKPVTLQIPPNTDHGLQSFDLTGHLRLRTIYHRRRNGSFLITVSILNTRVATGDRFPSGADCYFQTEFDVTAPNNEYVFHEYCASARSSRDAEDVSLELLYRNRTAFAAGHGCAANWDNELDGKTKRITTSTVPAFKVAPVQPREGDGDELSMFFLAGAEGKVEREEIPRALENLVREYNAWIEAREADVGALSDRLQDAARNNLDLCRQCSSRIKAGIDLLRSNSTMLTAFMLANRAILMQQYHFRRDRRSLAGTWEDLPASYEPKNYKEGRWRTFQVAFILMNLPSLTKQEDGSDHPDRKLVDLIWFPTGGGKTEAYLGLAACDIFLRRLIKPANAGCTVLMRYTLRLLTAQQFQRASSMICACELIRRQDLYALGDEPITIGLWVGQSLTPIRRADAIKAVNALANKQRQAENPFQLLKCPWCGTELDNRDNLGYLAHPNPKTVIFKCPESRCPFSTRRMRLPVMVIDEDIYESPPTLIIGTVDKFAMLAWWGDTGSIFGQGTEYDPPDLIVQDELHLISGPLGSVVGLYESAIDLLCSRTGRGPKIVASTATIRRAPQQCQALYDRDTFQFPPQGLDISDSFFSVENPEAPGRIYTGVFASAAPSFVTAMIRTLSSLFQSCKSIPLPDGATEACRDPFWTVIQYFNSLRELGHAATLVEADIPEYMWAIASRDHIPKELCRRHLFSEELTSRRTADEIPRILERLEVRFPHKFEDDQYPLDTLLATNMISVGVDVSRLGLMVVAGQPKTTSEYIQATSRVGRSDEAPGLVIAMYNPGKPRDRSHYEHFRAYHSSFYRFVEPTSITPYSIPALDRALHAVLIVIVRHLACVDSPDKIDPSARTIDEAIEYIRARCDRADPEHSELVVNKLRALLKQWDEFRPGTWGGFGRPPENQPLMYPAGTEPRIEWDVSWPTPTSMRNVDVECLARVVSTYPRAND